MRAILDDRARLQRMLDFEAALARARSAGRHRPGARRRADRRGRPRRPLRPRGAGRGRRGRRQYRHPAGQRAHRRGRQDRCGSGGLRPLGRHQPGRHRQRAGARAARGDRCPDRRPRPRHRRVHHARRRVIAAPPPSRAPGCSTRCRCRSGSSSPATRRRWRVRASGCSGCASEALVLQFGGAAGTLAALGDRGLEVAERLAALLDLPLPDAPWHSHRDRLAEVAAAFAILTGTCGKIARDVSLLMQTEVAEAFEPAAPGRGGSSTMPHKRNPTAAATALAAATIAPNLLATICRRAGAGARARARRLAGGMAGVSRAGARHLRRARCHRRHCGRARSRRSAHARQPRPRRGDASWPRRCRSRSRPSSASTRRMGSSRRPAARPPPPSAICRT